MNEKIFRGRSTNEHSIQNEEMGYFVLLCGYDLHGNRLDFPDEYQVVVSSFKTNKAILSEPFLANFYKLSGVCRCVYDITF